MIQPFPTDGRELQLVKGSFVKACHPFFLKTVVMNNGENQSRYQASATSESVDAVVALGAVLSLTVEVVLGGTAGAVDASGPGLG
jgi:hypothetical protein